MGDHTELSQMELRHRAEPKSENGDCFILDRYL